MQLTDRQTQVLATIATITAVSMYVSYIPQIQMNLAGQKGSALQPLVAAINCTLWVLYGLLKKPKKANHFSSLRLVRSGTPRTRIKIITKRHAKNIR